MSDNPFANPDADRYFSDQSVRAATAPTQQPVYQPQPPAAQAVLDDYNPFAGGPQQVKPVSPPPQQPVAPTFVQQQPVTVTSNPPPAAPQMASRTAGPAPSGQTSIDTQELQRRQEELERKAAELMRKEQELKNMQMGVLRTPNWPPLPSFCPCKPFVYMDIEAEIAVELQWLVRRIYHYWLLKTNNFPPLPACCKIKPCFYQDISVEIPVEFQRLLRLVFYYWMFLSGFLVWDMVLAMVFLILGDSNGGASFGICLVNFVLCIPLSYVCWFRPVYKAFRDDSSFNFFIFFIVFAVQFVVHCLHAVGIPGYVPGFINGFYQINQSASRTALGIVAIVSGVVHGLMAAADAFVLLRVHALYRASGASLQRAQAEFASGVMSNKGVQQAAAQAAQAAAANAFSGGQPSGNRF